MGEHGSQFNCGGVKSDTAAVCYLCGMLRPTPAPPARTDVATLSCSHCGRFVNELDMLNFDRMIEVCCECKANYYNTCKNCSNWFLESYLQERKGFCGAGSCQQHALDLPPPPPMRRSRSKNFDNLMRDFPDRAQKPARKSEGRTATGKSPAGDASKPQFR